MGVWVACIFVHHVHLCPHHPGKCAESPRTEVIGCELLCGCWESEPAPLEEQSASKHSAILPAPPSPLHIHTYTHNLKTNKVERNQGRHLASAWACTHKCICEPAHKSNMQPLWGIPTALDRCVTANVTREPHDRDHYGPFP